MGIRVSEVIPVLKRFVFVRHDFDTEKVCCKGRALVRQRQVQKDMAKIQRDVAIANVVAQSNNASNYAPGNASYVNVSLFYLHTDKQINLWTVHFRNFGPSTFILPDHPLLLLNKSDRPL